MVWTKVVSLKSVEFCWFSPVECERETLGLGRFQRQVWDVFWDVPDAVGAWVLRLLSITVILGLWSSSMGKGYGASFHPLSDRIKAQWLIQALLQATEFGHSFNQRTKPLTCDLDDLSDLQYRTENNQHPQQFSQETIFNHQ